MVRRGRVRQVDKVGSDRADEAADFGRRRVPVGVTDCREASRARLSALVSHCV